MPYKTILVYLNDERRIGQVLDVANDIASRFSAHLIGLYVVPSAIVDPAAGFGGGIVIGSGLAEHGRAQFRGTGERIRKTFEAATRGRPFVSEFRIVEQPDGTPDCAATVVEQNRFVDVQADAVPSPVLNTGVIGNGTA